MNDTDEDITQEMIEAGVDELRSHRIGPLRDIVIDVYNMMRAYRPKIELKRQAIIYLRKQDHVYC